jgi:hypothetical protein
MPTVGIVETGFLLILNSEVKELRTRLTAPYRGSERSGEADLF